MVELWSIYHLYPSMSHQDLGIHKDQLGIHWEFQAWRCSFTHLLWTTQKSTSKGAEATEILLKQLVVKSNLE